MTTTIGPGFQVTPSVKLSRALGEGGMGSVWVADHSGLGAEVAVKFLLGEHVDDPQVRARFAQEASSSSRVKSSHVVKVYDFGVTGDGVPYLVMELLEGRDLRAVLDEQKRLPPAETIAIVAQLCRALERAHEAGVIHRDIKPENVFLCTEGGERFVKLLDFGLAKAKKPLTASDARSTYSNEALGTPFYMSPEQFRSAKLSDARTDLWAVGVLTYEAITGTLPFIGDSIGGLAIVVSENQPYPPSHYDASLPPAFDAWFAKACASKPEDRFASARDLVTSLRAAFGDTTPSVNLSVQSGPNLALTSNAAHTDLSLRDTTFAHDAEPPALRRGWIVLAVLASIAVAIVAVLVQSRHDARTPMTQAIARPTHSVAASATASSDPVAPSTPTTLPSASVVSSVAVPSHSAARVVPVASASTQAQSPPTGKKDERDIY